jgi:aryl-alcohol dehydrogenase-like predicted oxidoreductase
MEIVSRGWAHVIQVLYNVLNQAPARELFPAAQAKGYGIIARVPLASGLLTGKFRADSQFSADDVRQNFLTPRRLQEAVDAVDEAKAIIGGSARSLAEAALRFVLAHEAVSTTIPGAKTMHQVETNAAAGEGALPPDVVEKLRSRLGEVNFYQKHGIRI